MIFNSEDKDFGPHIGEFLEDSGLHAMEAEGIYTSQITVTCGSKICQGEVQWRARMIRSGDWCDVVDVYPGHEYCFVCGRENPKVWESRKK